VAGAEVFDAGLAVAGVVATFTAIGSGLGVTIAIIGRRPRRDVELWALWGTAVGYMVGVSLALAALVMALS
jgi:hypothetical protein